MNNKVVDDDTSNSENRLSLIQAHFARIARRLEAEGLAAKSFNQGTNRGQIREVFIREFLSHNTSSLTGIGTGEVIHADSKPSDSRKQIDVVIHNNRYPKISLAAGIDLFFQETVSSVIEIKSNLKKEHVIKAAQTAKSIKSTTEMESQGLNPTGLVETPRTYCFIFAYDGPSKIITVFNWMKEIASEDEYNLNQLRTTPGEEREFFNHLFIDGIFVLGKGFVYLDALPFQSELESATTRRGMKLSTDHIWVYGEENELPILWTLINVLSEKNLWNNLDLTKYFGKFDRYFSE